MQASMSFVEKGRLSVSPLDRYSTLFTIGTSNRSWEEFVSMLKQHNIVQVVDLRSKNGSRVPHFDERRFHSLSRNLPQVGIHYEESLHEILGGMQSLDGTMRIKDFRKYLQSPYGQVALQQLVRTIRNVDGNTVIMCCERDHRQCHRRVVADSLALEGWEIIHL